MKKRMVLTLAIASAAMNLGTTGAQALTSVPPTSQVVDVSIVCRVWGEPYGELLNAKLHPVRVVVLGVDCGGPSTVSEREFRRQACEIIAATYGRWVQDRTWMGEGKRSVWQPLRCADVLGAPVPHGAIPDWRL